ncbi:hypothetical protein [Mesorhizobium sp. LSJC285A00]|uniref:hypothetical protein n=1 Tax=Mesorhizobium sp. LSJC285A00 TaxID=1287338 RepID=UPI0012EB69C7|nr:hypothetical protein [Mesorhizobium sp. LSJC285A00]
MDIFDSAIRRKGDLAGVFEHDDTEGPANATAYFYLYEAHDEVVGRIIGAIHIRSGAWAITEADIAVQWDNDERRVGLFVFGTLSAAFDAATGAIRHGLPARNSLVLRSNR